MEVGVDGVCIGIVPLARVRDFSARFHLQICLGNRKHITSFASMERVLYKVFSSILHCLTCVLFVLCCFMMYSRTIALPSKCLLLNCTRL